MGFVLAKAYQDTSKNVFLHPRTIHGIFNTYWLTDILYLLSTFCKKTGFLNDKLSFTGNMIARVPGFLPTGQDVS
jgi:hypothetical protein